ncbi:hypothetical protein EMPG_14993 [Blastomyces silverae]|uniref:Uncharacterized protein n=1 Tax=Blastomyces silverae TaxID=2060906 RepID=A0A0H1BE15_9EURO|nr:hypothetical protein EMPG_14993 [Blastomyces silverae]
MHKSYKGGNLIRCLPCTARFGKPPRICDGNKRTTVSNKGTVIHSSVYRYLIQTPNPNGQEPPYYRDMLDPLFRKRIPKLGRVSEERFEASSQHYGLKHKGEERLDIGIDAGAESSFRCKQGEYLAPGDDYRELEDDLIVQNYQLEKAQNKLSNTFHCMKHSNKEGTSTYSDDLGDDSSSSSQVSAGFGKI